LNGEENREQEREDGQVCVEYDCQEKPEHHCRSDGEDGQEEGLAGRVLRCPRPLTARTVPSPEAPSRLKELTVPECCSVRSASDLSYYPPKQVGHDERANRAEQQENDGRYGEGGKNHRRDLGQ